jgi:exodeoxyribonuclease VII large subunit
MVKLMQSRLDALVARFSHAVTQGTALPKERLDRAGTRLELLNPQLVLQRGYAWLASTENHAITRVSQTHTGQAVRATLMDGQVDLTVSSPRLI